MLDANELLERIRRKKMRRDILTYFVIIFIGSIIIVGTFLFCILIGK